MNQQSSDDTSCVDRVKKSFAGNRQADSQAIRRNVLKMALMQVDIEEEKKYKEMFRILDTNIVGYIKNDELAAVIDKMKVEVGMKDEEVKQLVDDIDKNKDQKIQFNEFYKFMSESEEADETEQQ